MAADVLTPYVTRSSTAIVLNVQDKWLCLPQGFQQPLPSQRREVIENAKNVFVLLKQMQLNKD